MDFNDFFEEKENLYEKVPELDKATLMKWMKKAAVAISEKLKSARNNTSRRLITDAKNVVAERYMEPDFSLDTVCSVLGVCNSYFSTIFKKETGKSFITYLTDYRMDVAVRLIVETNDKSYEIGEKVGYLDANYFSYVFKKKFGVSPSKYRASGKKENEK